MIVYKQYPIIKTKFTILKRPESMGIITGTIFLVCVILLQPFMSSSVNQSFYTIWHLYSLNLDIQCWFTIHMYDVTSWFCR